MLPCRRYLFRLISGHSSRGLYIVYHNKYFPISIDTRPLDRDLYERARRRANKVQLKKVYAFYTEEDTELLWFAQVLEKPRVVVQGDIVCGTRATAANVREESLIVKIRWFERKEDEAGSAYYQPELQDKDWP